MLTFPQLVAPRGLNSGAQCCKLPPVREGRGNPGPESPQGELPSSTASPRPRSRRRREPRLAQLPTSIWTPSRPADDPARHSTIPRLFSRRRRFQAPRLARHLAALAGFRVAIDSSRGMPTGERPRHNRRPFPSAGLACSSRGRRGSGDGDLSCVAGVSASCPPTLCRVQH